MEKGRNPIDLEVDRAFSKRLSENRGGRRKEHGGTEATATSLD